MGSLKNSKLENFEMAKGKKGKKNSNLTDEERFQKEQEKAAAEEAERIAQQQMILNYLKDKLAKEEKYSRLNNKKLVEKWRAIMRQAKSAELKKEIVILSQTFERIMDRKSAVIQQLAKDLEESEEQNRMATRAHQSNLGKLNEIQQSLVDDLEKRFQTQLEENKKTFDTDTTSFVEKTKQSDEDFDTLNCALEQTNINLSGKIQENFQSLRDELKNQTLEEKHSLRIQLEGAVENLWKQFQAAQKQYNESTQERRKEFEKLQRKDAKSSKEIEEQMKKLSKIQENINLLKQKMAANAKEYDEKHAGLKQNKETLDNHFRSLKKGMNKSRDQDREKLTKESDQCIKKCEKVQKVAADILKIGEMCRKLETEEEKVLPFGTVPPTPRSKEEDELLQKESNTKLANVVSDYEQLDGFWRRYNKAQLDKLALEAEKRSLENENHTLRSVLKQYLDGVSVNNETLKEPNPPFVTNQNFALTGIPVGDPHVQRPTQTVVEAAHIVNYTLP